MHRGELSGYQQYYELASETSATLSSRVAKCHNILKAIENSERAKNMELVPPDPMMQTLSDYIHEQGLPRFETSQQMVDKIGDRFSQYYHLVHTIASVMLL